jgi:hypothetical protein
MKLLDIAPGQPFTTAYTRRVGTVLSHSPGGTRVRWNGADKVVEVKSKRETGKAEVVVVFIRKSEPLVISSGTEVL